MKTTEAVIRNSSDLASLRRRSFENDEIDNQDSFRFLSQRLVEFSGVHDCILHGAGFTSSTVLSASGMVERSTDTLCSSDGIR